MLSQLLLCLLLYGAFSNSQPYESAPFLIATLSPNFQTGFLMEGQVISNIFLATVSSISFSDIEVIYFIRENSRNTENYKEMEITQAYHPWILQYIFFQFFSMKSFM